MTQRRDYTAADGVKLVAEVSGAPDGPTLVLMHGGGQTRHSWTEAAAALAAAGYRVINFDARGHGESGWSPDGIYNFPLRACDLSVVVDGLDNFALIGASMGGITAMQAISAGLRPEALVLVDIVLHPERAGVERIRNFMAGNPQGFATLDDAIDAVAAYNPTRPRSKNPQGLMRNLRTGADGRLYWHWDPRMVPPTIEDDMAMMAGLVAGMRFNSAIPALLVRGLRSDVVSDEGVAELRALMPHLEVFDVAGAGHMVAGDSNSVFNRGILDFLRRQYPPTVRSTT